MKKESFQLQQIHDADQEARISMFRCDMRKPHIFFEIEVADEKRRRAVEKIMAKPIDFTAQDYFHAAMVFQHGVYIEEYEKARRYAKRSMELGEERAKWLYAAATDRLLRAQGKKQKYGTQYVLGYIKENGVMYKVSLLQPYDKRTSDATRKKFDVPPIAEILAYEAKSRKIWK